MKRQIQVVQEPLQSFYFSFYEKSIQPIAVSNSKELVKIYMETHRYTKNYEIKEVKLYQKDVLTEYNDSFISQYENWYIPNIDIEIIKSGRRNLEREVNDVLEHLKSIILLVKDIKKVSNEEKEILIKAFQVVSQLKTRKKVWEKMIDNYKLSDLLFMEIDEYLRMKEVYIQMRAERRKLDYLLPEEGDIG